MTDKADAKGVVAKGTKDKSSTEITTREIIVVSDTSPDSILKFFRPNTHATPASFPALGKYVYWCRVAIALIYGSYLGIVGARGAQPVMIGFGLICFLPIQYLEKINKVDFDTWEKATNLSLEGCFNAAALLLFVWTVLYTTLHTDPEAMLKSAGVQAAKHAAEVASMGFGSDVFADPAVGVEGNLGGAELNAGEF